MRYEIIYKFIFYNISPPRSPRHHSTAKRAIFLNTLQHYSTSQTERSHNLHSFGSLLELWTWKSENKLCSSLSFPAKVVTTSSCPKKKHMLIKKSGSLVILFLNLFRTFFSLLHLHFRFRHMFFCSSCHNC